NYGRGIGIEHDPNTKERSSVTIQSSIVEQNREVGVGVIGSDATVDRAIVRGTERRDDALLGDGIAVVFLATPAAATITSTRIESNRRAGISSFGAAVALSSSVIACNGFDIDGETYSGHPFSFPYKGANLCGCAQPTVDQCKAVSTAIEPPPVAPS